MSPLNNFLPEEICNKIEDMACRKSVNGAKKSNELILIFKLNETATNVHDKLMQWLFRCLDTISDKVFDGHQYEWHIISQIKDNDYEDDNDIDDKGICTKLTNTIMVAIHISDYSWMSFNNDELTIPYNYSPSLTLLPQEIKMIENVKKRKEFFIQIVLPLIIQENNNIRLDRKTLFSIINKSNNTSSEINWLEKKYKQYGINTRDLSLLKIRMDEIPASLAIAQAAKETGWGTSRFAQEGNALFGQWTWSGDGLKPKDADKDQGHKVMKFNVLQASVRAYQRNLNTHSTYKDFRKARAEFRDLNKPLDSIELSTHLNKYAETGNQYVEVLKKIITQNKLKDFDDAKLLPSSIDLESLI